MKYIPILHIILTKGQVRQMTKTRKQIYRFVAYLTTIMMILSCFSILYNNGVRVKALKEMEIRSFSVGLADGAELSGGKYVWKPQYDDAGHLFVYRINYSLSGTGDFEAGEAEIRLPSRLLKDRSGNYADEFELSIPSRQELEDYDGDLSDIDTSFVYELDGDEIKIYNYHDGINGEKLKAGATGYIEVGYRTIYSTFSYADMAPSDDFWASIRLYDSHEQAIIDEKREEAPCVYINTYAELVSTTKRCLNMASPYTSWQNSWGTAPENAEQYYYLVWEISSYIGNVTQPYTFTITDVVSEPDVEPAAYKLWGTSKFTSQYSQSDLRADRFMRYDYVITKHLKSSYDPHENYTITNTETVTLTPKDLVDPEISATASAAFTNSTNFNVPIGYFNHRKWGNNNWFYYTGTHWDIANYGLQELRDGKTDHLNGNIKYRVNANAFTYKWTLEEGADITEPDSYGKKNVTFTLTDDTFYFNDNTEQTEDYRIIIPEEERQLTYEDYSVEYVNYNINIKDGVFSEQNREYVPTDVTYIDGDIIYFYGKFGSSSEWVQVGSYDLYRKEAVIDEHYAESLTAGCITFKDNCTGYRIETSNPHYSTSITATPYCRVKNSDYIMEQIADPSAEKVWLTNISEFTGSDYKGNILYNSRMMARDFIIGVDNHSEFDKRVITTRSNPLLRKVTVGWSVTMSEYYISNYGIEYTPQDSGTFYDLLPVGCGIDTSTVAVSTGVGTYSFLDKSDYTVSAEDNFRNSGRTMLTVHIKEQFSRAVLTYNTVYSWDSAIEYGLTLHNTTAYETDNEYITNGCPDTGGSIHDSEIMKNLDTSAEGDKFIYSEHDCQLRFLVASFTGLNKKVKTSADTEFTDETFIKQNGYYYYKLRYSTTAISRAKDMIFFDSLENYSFEDPETHGICTPVWHGRLSSVNVNQPKNELGIAPVVYYSDIENLDIEHHNDLDEVYNKRKVWQTEEEIGDISRARAVAIDLRHDAEGNDYILDYLSAVSVIINMQAPDSDTTGITDPVTYNNVFMDNTVIDMLENENPYFIHQEYTTVHFRIMSDINLLKVNSKDHTTPVKGITFTLSGTSFYGTEVNESAQSDKYGHITFNNIEKGEYTLSETKGSDDYLQNIEDAVVIIDDYGNVTVDHKPIGNGEYYKIEDDPRIHTDIEFFKSNIANKRQFIEGVKFVLSGKSDYGSDIYAEAVSSAGGKVLFKNIEKGTYELTEASTNSAYILCKVVYTVRVDVNGNFIITSPDPVFEAKTELNGTVNIYNEPYHSFTLQKEGTLKIEGEALPVQGAEYRLWGTSDYGTAYDITKTTQANGRILFDKLESGIYQLKETAAPDGYELDTQIYLAEVTPTDEITITGGDRIVSRNNMGYFVFTDREKGTVVITKKWIDNDETRQQRLADETEPVIHISTQPKRSEAYFRDSDVLTAVAGSKNNVLYFAPYTGDDDYVLDLIADGTAVKIDDETTDCSIYAWYINDQSAEDYKTVYWWSDAKNVYLTDESHKLWSSAANLKKVSADGINTSKVTDMSYMFENCTSLTDINVSSFDTSAVESFEGMFSTCKSLTSLDVSGFDTSHASKMGGMFNDCYVLSSLDLSSFDTKNVTDMSYMFNGCFAITGIDVSSFDTSNVENFEGTFASCRLLPKIDVSGFKTAKAENMCGMFYDCETITTVDVSDFNTENVTDMSLMFYYNIGLQSLDLSSFNTSRVTDMKYMFYGDSLLEILDVSSFDTSNVLNTHCMFQNCSKVRVLDVSGFDLSKAEDTAYMFSGCNAVKVLDISSFDLSNDKKMTGMFSGCSNVEYLDTASLDTSSATTMNTMFSGCSSLTELDVRGFDTSSVTDMAGMFSGCSGLTELDVGSFDTSSVTNMSSMFNKCSKLKSIDLSVFDTTSVQSMTSMFQQCVSLQTLDLSRFNTKNVTDMRQMFYYCTSLKTIDISNFDTSKLISTGQMFHCCYVLTAIDLSSWSTESITNTSNMFHDCRKLETIYVSELWDIDHLSAYASLNMFRMCMVLTGQNGTTLSNPYSDSSNIVNNTYAHIDTAENPGYLTYKAAPGSTGSGTATTTKLLRSEIRTTSSSAPISYSSLDNNCSIKKLSDDEWEYTFTGLDPTLQFYAWEDEFEGYTSLNMGEENFLQVVDGKAEIINRADDVPPPAPESGSLMITKLVEKEDGSELSAAELAKKFTFTLRLYDAQHQPVTGTALYGEVPYGKNGAVIKLAHGESITVSGIPSGYYYTVTETNETGYEQTVSEGSVNGQIMTDETASVTYTNRILEEKFVSFTLSKLVDGRYELNNDDYSFTLSFRGLRSGVSYTITGDNETTFTADERGTASAEITLKHNETVTVNNIPAGASYQVTESGGEYTSQYTITDTNELGKIRQTKGSTMSRRNASLSTQTETADEGEDIHITFTNTKDVRQDLTLKKTVTNVNNDDRFEFEVTFLNLPERETIEIEQYNAGSGELIQYRETADELGRLEKLNILLGADDTVIFRQLPVGTLYQITERKSAYRASYTLINSGTRGTILSPSAENALSNQTLTTGLRDLQGNYTQEGMEVINEGEDVLITFTNVKQQHDISVTKMVDMTNGDVPFAEYADEEFTFLFKLRGLEPSGTYKAEYTAINTTGIIRTENVTADDEGTLMYKIKLTHGQTYKLYDLPENAVYSVTEAAARHYQSEYVITSNDGAEITRTSAQSEKTNERLSTAAETVNVNDLDVKITFTNRYNASDYVLPDAGMNDSRPVFAVLFAGFMLFGAAFLFINRRRKTA